MSSKGKREYHCCCFYVQLITSPYGVMESMSGLWGEHMVSEFMDLYI